VRQDRVILKKDIKNDDKNNELMSNFFFSSITKQVSVIHKYNMWEAQKTMREETPKYLKKLLLFIIFDFVFYYSLAFNVVLHKRK